MFFFSSFCSCPKASSLLSDPKAVATSRCGCLTDNFILVSEQRWAARRGLLLSCLLCTKSGEAWRSWQRYRHRSNLPLSVQASDGRRQARLFPACCSLLLQPSPNPAARQQRGEASAVTAVPGGSPGSCDKALGKARRPGVTGERTKLGFLP